MDIKSRLDILLPRALNASRVNQLHRIVAPMTNTIWQDIPEDQPLQIRCALAEREQMRRVPIGLSAGELLAGRVDIDMPDPVPAEGLPWKVPFPGGQNSHTALDTPKLLRLGIVGIEHEINEQMQATDDPAKLDFYHSALISLEGFRELAARFAAMAEQLSLNSNDPDVRAEMAQLAELLHRVPNLPAQSFHEAIQVSHLLHFAAGFVVMGLYGPGRIDRYLRPFYEADLAAGRITRERALELICCQFIHINQMFTLPQPVIVGGLGADGHDSSDDLTMLCLEAEELVQLVNPSLALCVNEETPREILDKAATMLLNGRTKPSLFGDRTIIAGLQARGVPYEDAIGYVQSTCVEITLSGMSNILVASPYINLMKPLEFLLNDGKQMMGDEDLNDINGFSRIPVTPLAAYDSFEEFLDGYFTQLGGKIADAAALMWDTRRSRVDGWAYPLVSCFTDDCIARGIDMDRGGARYNWTETSNVGLANIVDSLMVIKKKVFENPQYSLTDVKQMLLSDFTDEAKRLDLLTGVVRYGNDESEPDALASQIIERIYAEHARHKDYLGGEFVPGFFCWIMHRILGGQTSASPDGRRAGDVLADGSGAGQGRDRNGPTAAIRSVTSWDHQPGLGGVVLNLRFAPHGFRDLSSRSKLVDMIRTYFQLGGFEMQVNAVDSQLLREAQQTPDKFADLLVRVAGYSDYFTLLDHKMQEEVISRTQHQLGS